MPFALRLRKLGAPLYGHLFKKKELSSSGKQSYVARTCSRVVRALNIHRGPSAPPPPSLPVELWMKIVQELGHKEWIALFRVCWLLYRIAQPFLYEDVILRVQENDRRERSNRRLDDPQPRLKRTISQRPELGAYVRRLTLEIFDLAGPGHRQRYPLLFELHLFPSLESLQVSHIHIDLELCNILHSHPRLKSVTVDSCTLDESLAIGRIDQDDFPHSSISTVEILSPKQNPLFHGWAALAPANLETLAVYTSQESDASLILNSIRELNKTSFLTTLSLDTLSPAVVRFLIASPQLRHFALDYWKNEYKFIASSLPADAIPLLEKYSGPAEISSTFIQGRPVHTVKFTFLRPPSEDRLIKILNSLQYSAVPLTSLEFVFWYAAVGSWLSHIPVTVRCLTFYYLDWATFIKWLPALSYLTSLRTLSFPGNFSLPIQRELDRGEIMLLSNTFQSLREIDIGPQRWRMGGKRGWELFTVFMD